MITTVQGAEGDTTVRGAEGDTIVWGVEGDTIVWGAESDTTVWGLRVIPQYGAHTVVSVTSATLIQCI